MRRALHIIMALLVVVLVVGLYKAKTDAAQTEAHVRQLQRQISDEESDQRALKAEIAHLESPGHVDTLTQDHLELTPAQQGQALPASAINDRLPAPRKPNAPAHP
jgi:cell division protein FtsL